MKKSVLFILLIVSCMSPSFSQLELKNKLNLGYDMNYFPGTIGDQHTEEFPLASKVKYAHMEHTITATYRVKSRISISVLGGFMSNKATALESGPYYLNDSALGIVRTISYGFGVNFHLKKGYAPTGNYFGVYIRKHDLLIANNSLKAIYRSHWSEYDNEYSGFTNEDFRLNVTYLGVKYNYSHMLFKKLPLSINAGMGLFIPISVKVSKPQYEFRKANTYQPYHYQKRVYFENSIEELQKFYRNINIFRMNIGIAYCF